jgi:ribosome recycling factor
MLEDVNNYIGKAKHYMDDAIVHLDLELAKIRTGKASPSMLNGILVDYYGNPTPLNQVANVGASDAKTLTIQPWEKTMLSAIEQSIFAANLGLTPMNDGELIRISIPPLTEERRKEMVKRAKALGEEGKISLRNARHKVMEFIKKAVKDGLSEDLGKDKEEEIQNIINDYGKKVDEMVVAKEKDIMTI